MDGIPKYGVPKTAIFGIPQFGIPGVLHGIPNLKDQYKSERWGNNI